MDRTVFHARKDMLSNANRPFSQNDACIVPARMASGKQSFFMLADLASFACASRGNRRIYGHLKGGAWSFPVFEKYARQGHLYRRNCV
jgi:hypothetical protein